MHGFQFVFLGQTNLNRQPNGLVRAIYKSGNVYEGIMSPSGLYNGWGIKYGYDRII